MVSYFLSIPTHSKFDIKKISTEVASSEQTSSRNTLTLGGLKIFAGSDSTETTNSSRKHTSWLEARLLQSGLHEDLVKDCEQKLILQEGFASESDFVDLLPSELHVSYLNTIGISGKGVQNVLIKLHRELHAQYHLHVLSPARIPTAEVPHGNLF